MNRVKLFGLAAGSAMLAVGTSAQADEPLFKSLKIDLIEKHTATYGSFGESERSFLIEPLRVGNRIIYKIDNGNGSITCIVDGRATSLAQTFELDKSVSKNFNCGTGGGLKSEVFLSSNSSVNAMADGETILLVNSVLRETSGSKRDMVESDTSSISVRFTKNNCYVMTASREYVKDWFRGTHMHSRTEESTVRFRRACKIEYL